RAGAAERGKARALRRPGRRPADWDDRFRQFAWGLAMLARRGEVSSRAIGRTMAAVAQGRLDWFDPEERGY
ncbi:MAG: hypothetical protein AB1609_16405, partial [Bacillota bacterium]